MSVKFTPEAMEDLATIEVHIATDNPRRAETFIEELRVRCLGLDEYPQAFPLLPGYEREGLRRHVYKNYLILFRHHRGAVEIVRIVRGARDYERLLKPAP